MNRHRRHDPNWVVEISKSSLQTEPPCLPAALDALGIRAKSDKFTESLPFLLDDTTAGSESELQAAVMGSAENVDLAIQIRQSNFFANIIKHAAAEETSRRTITEIERFLTSNTDQVWENSWVRIPLKRLNASAKRILAEDMRSRRSDVNSEPRSDAHKFLFRDGSGEEYVRVPVSYLLKLCLAQLLGAQERMPTVIYHTIHRMMAHFINDNCSPETLSFYVAPLSRKHGGDALARETAVRFLLTHVLLMYANEVFGLRAHGQSALAYFSPTPPLRQKQLNDCVSDAYYRDLFCSPCLSGWDEGEQKYRYMLLCHEVLSRSQLNALVKLRDAGIITSNLVVLPNTSNVSLSNNGTHISIGSRRIKNALEDPSSGFTRVHEKYVSDLTVKIVEHFLPLFVGTYTAAPYRYAFPDFHPEKILGYLPHQLDYTHLRMLWRQWKGKADLKFFGHALTPLGPNWLDGPIARIFRLRGDHVPDARLLDYLVALGSTDQSPALDGTMGNQERLRRDLSDFGVFDERMAFYMLFRPREHAKVGFSGYEARFYSLFEDLTGDMAHAVNLQVLVTALAYKYMAHGRLGHGHIPDTRSVESERRQIFFAMAMGLPEFYVRKDTRNQFMAEILRHCDKVRPSHRHRGYVKVYSAEYRKALLAMLRQDAADLIEMQDMQATLHDLERKVYDPQRHSAAAKLTSAILNEAGERSPLGMPAHEFNIAAEQYYRGALKSRHLEQALAYLENDMKQLDSIEDLSSAQRWAVNYTIGGKSALEFLMKARRGVIAETLPLSELEKFLSLMFVTIHVNAERSGDHKDDAAPICRAGNG